MGGGSGRRGIGFEVVGSVVVWDVGAFAGDGVGAEVGIVGGEGAGGDGDAGSVVGVAVGAVGVGAKGSDGAEDTGGVVGVAVTADVAVGRGVGVNVDESVVGGISVGFTIVEGGRVDDAAGGVEVAVVVGIKTRGLWGVSEVDDDESGGQGRAG